MKTLEMFPKIWTQCWSSNRTFEHYYKFKHQLRPNPSFLSSKGHTELVMTAFKKYISSYTSPDTGSWMNTLSATDSPCHFSRLDVLAWFLMWEEYKGEYPE